MTPDEASKVLAPYLWEIEKRELFEFDTIYFFNVQERVKNKNQEKDDGTPKMGEYDAATNNGFDTDQ
eukprot:CAMPEP_0116871776 /NCGR_PEP_ID=MMETSP0463-20121206/2269_1 /TAXON_ID=181622 /ORGANISM="Strombidinopsis sp, Strain SopsisLIS2011" /LENGTH=66 /DNA_ID=CAMNT_0004510821 /DNA_START=1110 /DNA_END=1310 /DNA_ORIENTATION=-